MKFPAVERTLVNAQFGSVTLHVSQSNAGRLPHTLPEPRVNHTPPPPVAGRAAEKAAPPADPGYRQTGCNAWSRSAGRCLVIDLLPAQCIPHRRAVDRNGRLAFA